MLLKVLERNALKERRSTPLFSVVHHEIAMFYTRSGFGPMSAVSHDFSGIFAAS